MEYADFFTKAVGGNKPYPYQTRLAGEAETTKILKAPTGAGKTEAVILGWLYRKFEHQDSTVRESEPQRLIYCLPMRTLVEQTETRARKWLTRLGWSDRVGLTILMGGELREEWHLEPEKPRIVIGTQDMLLSRAMKGLWAKPVHVACGSRVAQQRLPMGDGRAATDGRRACHDRPTRRAKRETANLRADSKRLDVSHD